MRRASEPSPEIVSFYAGRETTRIFEVKFAHLDMDEFQPLFVLNRDLYVLAGDRLTSSSSDGDQVYYDHNVVVIENQAAQKRTSKSDRF